LRFPEFLQFLTVKILNLGVPKNLRSHTLIEKGLEAFLDGFRRIA